MLRNPARTFGDLLSETGRPANRWQQLKEKSLSARRSFSPNTRFELPYRARSPILSSSDEDEKVDRNDRSSRSRAPSPGSYICPEAKVHNKKQLNPACSFFHPDLEDDNGSHSGDLGSHSDMITPMSSPRIMDLGLSTPPPEGYMDDFITGIFMTLDENGDPVFPDEEDEIKNKKKETPSAFLFLGDNGSFSVMNKENVKANSTSHNNKKWHSPSSQDGKHGNAMEYGTEKMELESMGAGLGADLPGGYGTFHTRAGGNRVLCYD